MSKKRAQPTVPGSQNPLSAIDKVKTQNLQLRDLRLLASSTYLNPAIHPKDLPKEVTQQIKVQCARSDEESSLIYMTDFALKSNLENGDPALSVSVQFGLIYRFETLEGIDEQAATAFGQTTVLFCIWPYWREFVQNMVARMGLPPIRIPPMRPSDLRFSSSAQAQGQSGKPIKKAKRRK